jgi:hypothetical protein
MTQTAQMPTDPQRLRALEHANAVRLARAELKRRIAEGETSAAAVILECPDAVRKWTVSELLMSQRRWGSTRCRKFLERNGISELKPIGSLTERQRRLLAQQLSGCAAIATNGEQVAIAAEHEQVAIAAEPEPERVAVAAERERERELVLV